MLGALRLIFETSLSASIYKLIIQDASGAKVLELEQSGVG